MPRFFFSTAKGDDVSTDARDVDLPTLDAARQHALRTLAGILFDEVLLGQNDIAIEVQIDDEHGGRVASLASSTRIIFAVQSDEDGDRRATQTSEASTGA